MATGLPIKFLEPNFSDEVLRRKKVVGSSLAIFKFSEAAKLVHFLEQKNSQQEVNIEKNRICEANTLAH